MEAPAKVVLDENTVFHILSHDTQLLPSADAGK